MEAKVEEVLASEIIRVGWGGLTSYQFGKPEWVPGCAAVPVIIYDSTIGS